MKTKTLISYLIAILIAVMLFPTFLFTAIEMVTYDKNFYKVQYEKLGTAEIIGIDNDELLRVTGELTDYIRNRSESLEPIQAEIMGVHRQVFNEREILHMIDVKELFQFGFRLRNICLISIVVLSLLLYWISSGKSLKICAKSYLIVSTLLLLLLLIGGPIISSNFAYYWDQFHYLFFDNDLWLLNPATDIMIQMVPEPFFYQAVFRVLTYFGLGIMIIGAASFWILRSERKKNDSKV
ncbi:MAG: TIGR01906 family membrane protein [Clostridiales bacterium]|nr:TIGR01906 family membrane protein [Clostridiales bacterium]